MKIGDSVITPDGKGKIVKTVGTKPKDHLLIQIESDKYWPHWNIYYHIKEIKHELQPKQ